MINNNDQDDGLESPIDPSIRSEIIRMRVTKEERSIIELDCKSVRSPYISTFLREYYFKTRNSETVIIYSNDVGDLKNIENVISAQSKLNDALSLLKKHTNSFNSLTSDKHNELHDLLKEVMLELHTIKARLRG